MDLGIVGVLFCLACHGQVLGRPQTLGRSLCSPLRVSPPQTAAVARPSSGYLVPLSGIIMDRHSQKLESSLETNCTATGYPLELRDEATQQAMLSKYGFPLTTITTSTASVQAGAHIMCIQDNDRAVSLVLLFVHTRMV